MNPSEFNTPKSPEVILSCAQPTGKLHLGNYLGAVARWSEIQGKLRYAKSTCFFGIVDQHAITVPQEPTKLRQTTLEMVAWYLACGLDPAKVHIFVQSHIHGHTELAWILGCLCPLGQLERMTQFKDKSVKQESVNAGLLYYPVLMAADILLYNADEVPVGDDQKQHLELARDLAEKFNRTYSETFKVPKPGLTTNTGRIASLTNPEKKMSKSDEDSAGTLYLTDSPDVLQKKIMAAVTDSGKEICRGPGKQGIENLLDIYTATTGILFPSEEITTKGYGVFKRAVAKAVIDKIVPVQNEFHRLMANKDYLLSVLKRGNDAAQKVANETLDKVYPEVGFLDRPR